MTFPENPPASHLYTGRPEESGPTNFWPPRVVWARELGWLNIRDQFGQWHCIPAKEAPTGYVRLANQAKGKRY